MDTQNNNIAEDGKPENYKFYVVAPKKFSILFLTSLGLYSIYWVYKNWSIYKKSSGANIWPIIRGMFDLFFIHSLCSKILAKNSVNPSAKERSALEWQATKYVLLTFSARICEHLAENIMPYAYLFSILLLPFCLQALYTIQVKINQSMNDENGESNSIFSWANYIWITLGILLWLLIIVDVIL